MAVLYVAGVPVWGDPEACGPFADAVKNADLIIGEERGVTLKMLSRAGAPGKRALFLNEHSSSEERKEIVRETVLCGSAVFFSDAGTPCVSDPDYKFVKMCRESGVVVRSVPGPSSLTAAISVSGIDASRFYFAGFPPREKRPRRAFWDEIFSLSCASVFMERPYALASVLKELIPYGRSLSVSINLGSPDELNLYGPPGDILKRAEGIKAPFVAVVPGAASGERGLKRNGRQ